MTKRTSALGGAIAIAGVLALGVSGCAASASGSAEASGEYEVGLRFLDGWAKASDGEMTAVFGVLDNRGPDPITVTSVSCEGAAEAELHETVSAGDGMEMREVDGGFVVPARGTLELAPGGNHVMLIGLTGPIQPGDTVSCTLPADDGSNLVISVPAKDFAGANETYSE